MKVSLGIIAGITLSFVVYAMKQPTLGALFYRDQPGTPVGHQHKYRTCHEGVWTEGGW